MLSIFIVAIAIPFIIKIVRYVVLYVLLPPVSWKEYEGEWAIITGHFSRFYSLSFFLFLLKKITSIGASEGIGLAFAHSCARRNINVVLVARNKRTLFEVCVDIEGRVPGVRAIPVSCSVTNADIYKSMLKKITQSLNVTLIINCLGGDAGKKTLSFFGFLLYNVFFRYFV